MKTRTFIIGALASAIAGAGCSTNHSRPTQSITVDSGTLTGTVTGPAALGFPAAVHDLGSGQPGLPLAISQPGSPQSARYCEMAAGSRAQSALLRLRNGAAAAPERGPSRAQRGGDAPPPGPAEPVRHGVH